MSQRFSSPAVEESVACNLIPMIDIMFLLLLFFMLGADMTRRELEEVRLPKADRCEVDTRTHCFESGCSTVNVFHAIASEQLACSFHGAGGVCRDPTHWRVSLHGNQYTAAGVVSPLREDARLDLAETTGTDGRRMSSREIMIRADQDAPYSVIQGVIESCAAAGLYKVEVGAVKSERP